ncbi:amino acid permease [Methylocystis heyeri]|uniref:Amino acid permease n=1 Tax=Methylocystis heyeri TaxID=391905 RepID=A0A6B8KIG7_9HYPH|nr:amino acid permease [Methylocystis heyeri]QGM46308.1 amino acid permease [Methylocystis heyeri]
MEEDGALAEQSTTHIYLTRKSVEALLAANEGERHGLKRALGWASLMALGIGGIIGAGIFVLTGTAAAHYAGPGVMISFMLSGLACAFVALCYAELASLIPVSGSTYTYTYATLGEIFAWIIGWDLVLEYGAGAATIAVGWAGYLADTLAGFGIHPPAALMTAYFAEPSGHGQTTPGLFNVPAATIILLLTGILAFGTRESSRFNNVIVAIKVCVVLAVIVFGVAHVNPANWIPLVPENTGEFGHFGWSGVVTGASVVFFAYIGFDAVSTAAQEAHTPQRDVPIGILGSLIICTILYIAVAAVATGIVPFKELGVPDPIAVAMDRTGVAWLSWMVKFGALAGLTTAMLVLLFGQTRVFYAMAQDGLLPPLFARLHDSWRTPAISQVLVGVLTALIAGLLPIEVLGKLVNIGTLAAFALVCGAVLHLRRTSPELPRPFRAPGIPWLPILGILSCLGLMAFLPLLTWISLIGWTGIGLVVYFLYGARHARR